MRHVLLSLMILFLVFVPALAAVEHGMAEGALYDASPMPGAPRSTLRDQKFFDSLSAEEAFPAWEHFLSTWQQNFQLRYRLWDDSTPAEFAFNGECQFDCKELEISTDVRQDEIVATPIPPKDLTLKLTDNSLASLKDAGIPEEVIELLREMHGRTFEDETQFAETMVKLIGKENLKEYKESVFQHAYVDKTLNSPWTVAFLRKTVEQSKSRQWRAWDDSLLSYKKKSTFLLEETRNAQKSGSARASEQAYKKPWLYRLRTFCERWGLPRPRTLLLLLLLLYLTTSLIKNFVQSR